MLLENLFESSEFRAIESMRRKGSQAYEDGSCLRAQVTLEIFNLVTPAGVVTSTTSPTLCSNRA